MMEKLQITPLVGGVADGYFTGKIEGDCDTSTEQIFLSSLRWLLYSRCDTYRLAYSEYNLSNATRAELAFFENFGDEENKFFVFYLAEPPEESNRSELGTRFGYVYLNKVHLMMNQMLPNCEAHCYNNPSSKTAVIFIRHTKRELRSKTALRLGLSIPVALPWFFESQPLTTEEKNFLGILKDGSFTNYCDYLDKMVKSTNLLEKFVEKQLAGFEIANYEQELLAKQREIADRDLEICSLKEQLSRCLTLREAAQTYVLGLEHRLLGEKGDSEFASYVACNKSLVLEGYADDILRFWVKTYATYYDKDELKGALGNSRSYLNQYPSQILLLIEHIFIKESFRLKMWASFSYKCGKEVVPIRGATLPRFLENYVANPHLDKHGCLGGYEMILSDLLSTSDHIGILETCIASASSLTWGDVSSMRELLKNLSSLFNNHDCSCIEFPDGSSKTITEAIEWIKQEVSE